MTPLATSIIGNPGHSWDYMLGKGTNIFCFFIVHLSLTILSDIFVAPMVESGTIRKVEFPEGNDWIHWFTGTEFKGGSTQSLTALFLFLFPQSDG